MQRVFHSIRTAIDDYMTRTQSLATLHHSYSTSCRDPFKHIAWAYMCLFSVKYYFYCVSTKARLMVVVKVHSCSHEMSVYNYTLTNILFCRLMWQSLLIFL